MWFLKLFNDDSLSSSVKILEKLKNQECKGVEYCAYKDCENEKVEELLRAIPEKSKSFHSTYQKTDMFSLVLERMDKKGMPKESMLMQGLRQKEIKMKKNAWDGLLRDIAIMNKASIKKITIHALDLDRMERKKVSTIFLKINAKEVAALAYEIVNEVYEKHGIRTHFENTFEPYAWFKVFIRELNFLWKEDVKEIKSPPFGFTFDIGHSKALCATRNSLDDWDDLLSWAHEEGIELMFHVHGNNGLEDQHKAITDAYQNGDFSEPFWWLNSFENGLLLIEKWQKKIDAPFILEFNPIFAKESEDLMRLISN